MYQAISVVHLRDDGRLDQRGGGKSGKKRMDLEYNLKVILTEVKDDFV